MLEENQAGGRQSKVDARFDRVPPEALKLIAECFGFGLNKYPDQANGEPNWYLIEKESHINHVLNHINEHRCGDTQEMHLVHTAVRAIMALQRAILDAEVPKTYSHPDMVTNGLEKE